MTIKSNHASFLARVMNPLAGNSLMSRMIRSLVTELIGPISPQHAPRAIGHQASSFANGNSISLMTNCSCGCSIRVNRAAGQILCPTCKNALGYACPSCGSTRLSHGHGTQCTSCGKSVAATRRVAKAKSPSVARAKRKTKHKEISSQAIQGVCDVLTGSPLTQGDPLYQCSKCTAFAKRSSLEEIKKHFRARCPACNSAKSYLPIQIITEEPSCRLPNTAAMPMAYSHHFTIVEVQSTHPNRSLLLKLQCSSGDAVPALIRPAMVRKLGGVRCIKQWVGRRISCKATMAYVPTWGEVRMVRTIDDIKEVTS